MREIKFRARKADLPTGWVYGYFAVRDGHNIIINDDGEFLVVAGTKCEFTGLKDKNGKEIYEGDIFSIPPDEHHHYEERNAVEYSTDGFLLVDHGLHLADWHDRGEVIGNIYENHELLEQ